MELSYEQKTEIGFMYIINRLHPSSPYGQERVRHLEPYTAAEQAELRLELDRLERLLAKKDELRQPVNQLKRTFMMMKDVRPALKKGREFCLSDIELFELKNFLIYSGEARKIAGRILEEAGISGLDYQETDEALDLLDPDGRRIPAFSIMDVYSEELARIRRQKRELERQMAACESGSEEWNALKETRADLVVAEDREEQRIRQWLTGQLRQYFAEIEANAEVTGRLDLLLEKMAAADFAPSVKPETGGQQLVLQEITNPWVASVLKEKGLKFTPLTLELSSGAGVITGANMGGKSVTLQTVTLNVLLALCGFYVYGEKAVVPVFDEIEIIAEARQSVQQGLSSFGAQIVNLKKLADLVDHRFCLVIMDEFARGTNPEEGAALVRAVCRYLNEKSSISLLVTHFDHVAEYGKVHYQVAGLKDMDLNQVSHEIAAAGEDRGVSVIAAHMNYGIFRVEEEADCPKDAFRICRLLGLQDEIMKLLDD